MLNNTPHSFDAPHSAPWAALFGRVEDRYARHHLRRLFAFCSARNVMPDEVSQGDVDAFGDAVRAGGVDRPNQVVRDAVRTWNEMAARHSDWPQINLVAPSRLGPRSLRLEDLPESFQADLEAYLHQSSGDDLFEERRRKGLSAATLDDKRRKIRRLVTVLVQSGRSPPSLLSLKDLVAGSAGRVILLSLWEACGRQSNGHCYNLARLLCGIAKDWAELSEEELKALKAAETRFRPTKVGMTERNRAKLRPFMDPINVARLLDCPHEAVARLDVDHLRASDAVTVQSALAVALLLVAPVRARNLAGIDLDRHIVRVSPETCLLVIPAEETKNDNALEFQLGPEVLLLLDLYLRHYRPLLEKVSSRKLFISWNGRQKTPGELGAQVPKFLKSELAIEMNLHLFRHFAGFVFLSHHPGEYETVRQLLGHKSLRTTVEFYTGLEQADAVRRYDDVLRGIRNKGKADE